MFEKEIKFIADYNLNKIKKLGSFFTFEKLTNTDIHPAVIQYISSEIDFLIYRDRKKLWQSSAFDYSGAEIAKYFNLIGQEIKRTKRISFEDIKKLIVQAVSFNVNHTVRPRWSLIKLIFNEDDVKQVDEINLIFNSAYFYDYVRNIFNAYARKKKTASVTLAEFELILNKIDKELFSSRAEELVENALNSIAEFHNLGSSRHNRISPSAIEVFLKEKNLMDYLFRLRKSLPLDAKQKYDITEIRNILFTATGETIVLPSADEEPDEEEAAIEQLEETAPDITEESIEEPESAGVEQELFKKEPEKPDAAVPEKESIQSKEAKGEVQKEEELPVPELEEETGETEVSDEADEDFVLPDIDKDLLSFYESALDSLEEDFKKKKKEQAKIKDEIDLQLAEDEEITEVKEAVKEELENSDEFKIEEEGEVFPPAEEEKEPDDFDLSDFDIDKMYDELTFDDDELFGKDIIPDKEESETEIAEDEEDTPELEKADDENLEFDKELEINEEPEDEGFTRIEEEPEDESFTRIEEEPETEGFTRIEDTDEFELELEKGEEEKKEEPAAGRDIPQRDKDIFSYLSNKDTGKIIAAIFNEDQDDFVNTMEKISECINYDEATEILKGVFLSYRINPYSKDAVTLTNAVSNYFDQA